MEFYRGDLSREPRIKLTKAMMEAARIPEMYWDCELSKIPETAQHYKALKAYVDDLPARDKAGKGLYLHGPYGRGKSGAAVAIMKEAMRRGARGMFIHALELESVFGKHLDEPYREAVLKSHFLVFDDVGAERSISWSPQWIETIMKLRISKKLPTIITSNDSPEKFIERLKAIGSILAGYYDDVFVAGHDWRMDGPPVAKT